MVRYYIIRKEVYEMAVPEGYTALARIGYADKGNYAAGTTYMTGDVVYHNGSSYVARKDNLKGVTPTNGNDWKYLARGFAAETMTDVQATDTNGVLGTAGAQVVSQALIDAIADRVMTKLVERSSIVQTESTSTTTVPSSAYFKQVTDGVISDIAQKADASNLENKTVVGTYNIPNITGVSTAPEQIAGGYHNVAKYSNGQCMYSMMVYVYTSAISNSIIGTISSQFSPKQDVSAYVYDVTGKRFLLVTIAPDGTIKLMTLEGTAIPESAVKARGSIVF